MKLRSVVVIAMLCRFAAVAEAADDYKIAAAEQARPDEVSAGIAKLLSPQALKVTSGKRTLCEIWLRRARCRSRPTSRRRRPSSIPSTWARWLGSFAFLGKRTTSVIRKSAPGSTHCDTDYSRLTAITWDVGDARFSAAIAGGPKPGSGEARGRRPIQVQPQRV